MKKVFVAALALVMIAAATARAEDDAAGAEQEFSEVDYYKEFAKKNLTAAQARRPIAKVVPVCYYEEDEKPANTIAVVPQYYHSRNGEAYFKVNGNNLKMAKSRANGAGVTVAYSRRVADWLTLGLSYQNVFMNVSGGMAVPAAVAGPAQEDVRWRSNLVGASSTLALPGIGRLNLSVVQAFNRASGHEERSGQIRGVDDYGTDVTSLMAWWEKDIPLGDGKWKITPYAGWRSLYLRISNANDWTGPAGAVSDSDDWVNLVSGGLKVSFQNGPLGVGLRGGVSHRTSTDDLAGFGNRAVAPGVVNVSHRANLDRTVGSVGASFSYAVNKRATIGVGYDGLFGSDTSAHMGSITVAFPF